MMTMLNKVLDYRTIEEQPDKSKEYEPFPPKNDTNGWESIFTLDLYTRNESQATSEALAGKTPLSQQPK